MGERLSVHKICLDTYSERFTMEEREEKARILISH
jgi:hypothetical protein